MSLLRRFYEEYGRVLGGAATRNFEEVEQALRANGYLDSVLKAAWPIVAPDKLVRSLLTYARRARRGGGRHPRRRRAEAALPARPGWSDGDVPLLDEARALLDDAAARRTAT